MGVVLPRDHGGRRVALWGNSAGQGRDPGNPALPPPGCPETAAPGLASVSGFQSPGYPLAGVKSCDPAPGGQGTPAASRLTGTPEILQN